MRSRTGILTVVLLSIGLLEACGSSRPPEPDERTDATEAPSTAKEVEPGLGPHTEDEPEPEPEPAIEDRGLEALERMLRTTRLTGDLDAMFQRGYIRVLVPYSKTFFFYDGARPRGLAYEFMEAFADDLRRSRRTVRFTVVYLPTPSSRLIPAIADGLGDLAIAGLTETASRSRQVEFVPHPSRKITEIVVTGPDAPRLRSVEDLSGQRVIVRESTSYHESLQALNARLRAMGRPEVRIVAADENLQIEDILELVRTGVESITVADSYLARFWSDVMEGLTVRDDLVVRDPRPFGPVVRKGSPQLVAAIASFQKTHGIGTTFGNVVANRYLRDNPWVRNPGATVDRERFEKALPIFRKYGNQYDFDALLLAAQGYQESRLDQSMRSTAGAVGLMQIKPSTAAAAPVNIPDVAASMDSNIHAAARYLRHLADHYFADPEVTSFNRHVFAIAAYNAGPARIQSLRRKAAKQGLDPNVWFDNVEIVAARVVGRENVDYVRKILKYWVAYRLTSDKLAAG